jgi:hypothetical protein
VTAARLSRAQIIRARVVRHDLHREPGSLRTASDVALLDQGVQDTGPDGSAWALAIRGAPAPGEDELFLAWTLRGAPHAYRRADAAEVVVATAPYSEADAAKRVFDASKPLLAADIPVLDALRTVADHGREIVSTPTVKGDLSAGLTATLDPPYLRECRPCNATHTYEQPFRLAALQAGLELEPGTSPPVLRRIKGLRPNRYRRLADEADPRFDVIRGHLRFFPGARVRDVAEFVDAPQKEVRAHWPDDAVEVSVSGVGGGKGRAEARFVLADDLDDLDLVGSDGGDGDRVIRLLGPYDPYLQLRDRELLVPEEPRRKDLWRVLGRPGAVLRDGEVAATWRPRTAKGRLTVVVDPWGRLSKADRAAIEVEASRLAAHRGVELAEIADT